jgi:hypothetical protein
MTLYSSVNWGIYGHMAGVGMVGQAPAIFHGYKEPRNIKSYIHRLYIPRYFHLLTEEYKLYSLV